MAMKTRSRFQKIYLQTCTLLYKNLLLFKNAWFWTILRAFVFPVAVALIFSFLIHIGESSSHVNTSNYGIATTSTPLRSLRQAIDTTSTNKLVFVRNGISDANIAPIVQRISQQPGMGNVQIHNVNDIDDLFDLCKQSLQGASDCYAAVIFTSFNETNVEYSLALDSELTHSYSEGSFRTDNSLLSTRLLPLQWAIDTSIGNISTNSFPNLQAFSGSFGPNSFYQREAPTAPTNGPYWLSLVSQFVAPIFILILIGVFYHLATLVATEREGSISELMAAQGVTLSSRILSTYLSFYLLYFPGFLACSIIMTQILFKRTSDILFLFITLLAGASSVTSAHFIASFFSKAQLAGLYTSVLAVALALVYLAASLTTSAPTGQITGLSLVFPPITWANFIGDVAMREYNLKAFSLVTAPLIVDDFGYAFKLQKMDGFLYIVFFLVQIFAYSVATFFVEKIIWGVNKKFDKIDGASDIAIRCRGLNKTFHAKRRWYWPFSKSGKTLLAVDNLDLEVKKGSITFLLGPNGSGKSTTLKLISGMASIDSGSYLELNEDAVIFGICPQQNVLWDNLTVDEHVKIWRKLKTAAFFDDNADSSTDKIADDDVIGECDLIEKSQAQAKTLSGGQMRKLQLAIAFVGSSNICCIDEATSGLDPLSRRMIWNIVQKGHTRRTVLMTTHFLDEADVLAHHIAIVYEGKLVCEGPSTSLKARFGDNHIIRSESDTNGNHTVFETTNSAEAASKISELEDESNEEKFSVAFPTLEQVFLKVTSSAKAAINTAGGDGLIGEKQIITVTNEITETQGEENPVRDIQLDAGNSIGIARQVLALFKKRHMLLRQKAGWISYGINMAIPIIITAALVKFHYRFKPLQTCQTNELRLRNGGSNYGFSASNEIPLESSYSPYIYVDVGTPTCYIGPQTSFSGQTQDSLYLSSLEGVQISQGYDSGSTCNNSTCAADLKLATRQFVNDTDSMIRGITNSSGYGYSGFGIFATTPESATLFYSTREYESAIVVGMSAFSIITNRLANSSTSSGSARISTAGVRSMAHATNSVNGFSLPISALVALAFIASASISVVYPTFERLNHVRALHYCNGVSPFALWAGYLLFDVQFILAQSIFVWGLLYTGPLSRLYYESSYLLGVFILFGIATYLGNYALSLFVNKAAFAIAAGIHVLLWVLYLVAYVMNQSFGDKTILHSTYSNIQYGLGLTSPAANLLRGLFVATNSFEILCGKYGDADVSKPFAYVRYGSVYANLLLQILFLIIVLYIYEYRSSNWFHSVFNRKVRASSDVKLAPRGSLPPVSEPNAILDVVGVSKQFRNVFAVEDVYFSIAADQVLALLGGNGAGKTTVINMIRGVLKPNTGEIYVDDVSVLRHPHQARTLMGVCPQDDAIDNLTVFETLKFYAQVKGLKDVVGNVTRVLNALKISNFTDVLVKDLSGGTRRKLSVAIALLGNPRVLLLDEPSTGQDAGAKRLLWKALQSVSFGRAILLTTHSMEEAEALATNVAIMGTKMLAIGSLSELQKEYGGNFTVRAVRAPHMNAAMAKSLIVAEFTGTEMLEYGDVQGQIIFRLSASNTTFGKMMGKMEKLKVNSMIDASPVIEDYTISGPTLEEVFMHVARVAGQYTGV